MAKGGRIIHYYGRNFSRRLDHRIRRGLCWDHEISALGFSEF
jgi:hypothetical protein